MRKLIWIMTMILLGYSFESSASVCVTEQTTYNTEYNYNITSDEIRCQQLKVVQDGLTVLSIATDAGTLYAACSGLGTPVAVYLGIAGLTVQTVKFAVSQLPCQPEADVLLIDQLVKENVCQELEKSGLKCGR